MQLLPSSRNLDFKRISQKCRAKTGHQSRNVKEVGNTSQMRRDKEVHIGSDLN